VNVQDATIASIRFNSGAIGSFASTCLLDWPHRIGLHLFSEGMVIELSEWDLMIDTGQGRPVRPAEGDAFKREDRAFIDAVKGKKNLVRVPYAEALRTHTLACAAATAAREGRSIRLAGNGAEHV
jgi:predicted dehydrogenase